ncbi:hypothetical protein [Pelagibacterium sp.]|uniref:hypothetical protein n=1 Tax=Pelagibacterium sp. TaxID=1967288 RepID=UPI003A901705
MTILSFPGPSAGEVKGKIHNRAMAAATNASEFMGRALDRFCVIAGDIEDEITGLDQAELDHVYEVLSDVVERGKSNTEDCLLYEIVTYEVERRCALAGLDTPWADVDDHGIPVADNDD